MPYAQYQLLVRFIRACAYKQANTPRNKEEKDTLLKTEEKEFDLHSILNMQEIFGEVLCYSKTRFCNKI